VTTGGSVSSGVSEGGGGDSVTYATPVVRSLASTAPPVRIKKDGVNMAAGLVLSTTVKAAGVTVAVGGKYTVEDTTTLPAVTLLMITMSAVTPAEEAISCLKLLSNVLRAAGSARDDMSMAANVMVELTVLTACWPAVDSGGGTMVTVGGGGDGGGAEEATVEGGGDGGGGDEEATGGEEATVEGGDDGGDEATVEGGGGDGGGGLGGGGLGGGGDGDGDGGGGDGGGDATDCVGGASQPASGAHES
jgi:hypothetical protein